jgi:circadian clock protein KaiC
MHLSVIHKAVEMFQPRVVVMDPISNLLTIGSSSEVSAMLTRMIDYLKSKQITALFTSLTSDGQHLEHTDVGVSSLIDTWLLLRELEANGERNRVLYLLKSRGMAHSNQVREFRLTDHGVQLTEVYLGAGGVLTGSARATREAEERAALLMRRQEIDSKRRQLERRQEALEAQIAALRAAFEAESQEELLLIDEAARRSQTLTDDREAIGRQRQRGGKNGEGTPNGRP